MTGADESYGGLPAGEFCQRDLERLRQAKRDGMVGIAGMCDACKAKVDAVHQAPDSGAPPWRWEGDDTDAVLVDANGERLIFEGFRSSPDGSIEIASPRVRALTEAAPEMETLLRHADSADDSDSLAAALDALMERDNGGTEEDLVRATENVAAFLQKARALLARIDAAAKAGGR